MREIITKRVIFTVDDVKQILQEHQGLPSDCEIKFHLTDVSTEEQRFPLYEVHQVALSYEVKR